MENINRIELQGRVGTVRTNLVNGTKVANFSLVTDHLYKTRDGIAISETTWHNIVVKQSGLAGVCEQYVKRGTPLLVVGKIQTRSYEDNAGQSRYVTEIVVEEMEYNPGKKSEQAPEYKPGGYQDDLPAD